MSAPKRGLGRGLDALLGVPKVVEPTGLMDIEIGTIRPNPRQPRTTFDAVALDELERSIRELGVLVPIIVRPLPVGGEARFELIAGERRWRAAAAARLATIPAIVRTADDGASLELAVVENLQRQDLDPLEEAMGFAHLIREYAYTQEALADRLGKSRPAIANALRLLGLSPAIQAKVRARTISVGHARALLALEEDRREETAERIVRTGLTVRDVERLGERRPKPERRELVARNADLDDVETRLRYALGAPVALVPAAKGGRLEIRYADADDLTRIVDVLLGGKP